jgi:selenocysteine lyase/cysteine desulfurase
VDELGGTVVTPARAGAPRGARVHQVDRRARARRGDGRRGDRHLLADGNLRVSPHAYNTEDEIRTVLAALERHRRLLA